MKELHSLGFRDVLKCEEALRLSGGEVKGALSLLQRPLLEPFHQRIWTDQPEPPIDPKHPDKQVRMHCKSPEGFQCASLQNYVSLWSEVKKAVWCFALLDFAITFTPCVLSAEDVPASASAVRPAQLGALRARPLVASRARRHLLSGGRSASCEGVARQGFHQASPHQRVPHLSEHLPPQQGGSVTV